MDTFMKKLLHFPTEFQREYDKIGGNVFQIACILS